MSWEVIRQNSFEREEIKLKHIIIVMLTLRMGGAEKALISLLKSLDPKRIDVDLYLFETGGVLQKEVPAWVKIIEADPVSRGMTLEMRNYMGEILKNRKFLAAADRIKITLRAKRGKSFFSWNIIKRHISRVEGHYDVAVGFMEGFADFFVLDRVDADRKIGWIHTDMTGRVPDRQEIVYYGQFDALATISDMCRNAFANIFPNTKGRIRVIENIVLPEEIIHKAEEMTDIEWDLSKVQLVSVGRLEYQKGFDIGAQVAKILRDRGYDFCWHVYGQGIMEEEIRQYIKENNLEKCYVLEGLKPNPYPYMKKADLIVQPSRWEGKSLVLDEAKILGKAIVVTRYPSVSDQIINEKTGIITDIKPEAIASGIEKLIRKKELRIQLEENCKREINRSYQVINQFYEMIGV